MRQAGGALVHREARFRPVCASWASPERGRSAKLASNACQNEGGMHVRSRLTIVFAAVAALGTGSVAIGASQAAPAPVAGLDYELFQDQGRADLHEEAPRPLALRRLSYRRQQFPASGGTRAGSNGLERRAVGQDVHLDRQTWSRLPTGRRAGFLIHPAGARGRRRSVPFRRPSIRKQERPGLQGPHAMGRREVSRHP